MPLKWNILIHHLSKERKLFLTFKLRIRLFICSILTHGCQGQWFIPPPWDTGTKPNLWLNYIFEMCTWKFVLKSHACIKEPKGLATREARNEKNLSGTKAGTWTWRNDLNTTEYRSFRKRFSADLLKLQSVSKSFQIGQTVSGGRLTKNKKQNTISCCKVIGLEKYNSAGQNQKNNCHQPKLNKRKSNLWGELLQ